MLDRSVAESPASQVQSVAESPASQVQSAASRHKSTAPGEVPKKKDGRGRPRKDRTLDLAKSAATPVSSAPVQSTLFNIHVE